MSPGFQWKRSDDDPGDRNTQDSCESFASCGKQQEPVTNTFSGLGGNRFPSEAESEDESMFCVWTRDIIRGQMKDWNVVRLHLA